MPRLTTWLWIIFKYLASQFGNMLNCIFRCIEIWDYEGISWSVLARKL